MPKQLIKCYFYGSLRNGEYNCNSFKRMYGDDNFVYQQTLDIEGFALYSLGSYPAIIPTEGATLIVDEFLVSQDAFNGVRRMELGAGYQEMIIDGAYIYHFTEQDKPYVGELVTHGDWSQYLRDKRESYV